MLHEKIHLADIYPFLGDGGKDPTLTTYLIENLSEMHWEERRHPCILICPGGGYTYCSQREQEPIALAFLSAGYHVFVLNYSVVPHRFPVQLQEVAAAITYISLKRDLWHCDPDHIVLMGFSAGGHLAAHYANSYDCPEVRTRFPESKPVFATVLGYPVITAEPPYAQRSTENLLGEQAPVRAMREKVSCEKLVSSRTPPAFLWHTASDSCVPVQNSLLYAFALAEHGVPFALRIYPEGRHGLATADDQTCEPLPAAVRSAGTWIRDAVSFLKYCMEQDRGTGPLTGPS